MNREGAELSLNVVIIAIILIIVLVVVIIIFGGRLNIFGKTSTACETQGGYCTPPISVGCSNTQGCCPSGEVLIPGAKCTIPLEICCLKATT